MGSATLTMLPSIVERNTPTATVSMTQRWVLLEGSLTKQAYLRGRQCARDLLPGRLLRFLPARIQASPHHVDGWVRHAFCLGHVLVQQHGDPRLEWALEQAHDSRGSGRIVFIILVDLT